MTRRRSNDGNKRASWVTVGRSAGCFRENQGPVPATLRALGKGGRAELKRNHFRGSDCVPGILSHHRFSRLQAFLDVDVLVAALLPPVERQVAVVDFEGQ